MGKLKGDIPKYAGIIVADLKFIGYNLDYSLESLKIVDDLIDQSFTNGNSTAGGFFPINYGQKVFGLASYLGELLISHCNEAKWQVDDTDPNGEINIAVAFKSGSIVWPDNEF
jgi:hypothetical protein